MKKVILLAMLSILLFSNVLAEDYARILTPGKMWKFVDGHNVNANPSDVYAEYNIFVDGDTIIDGKLMTRLVREYANGARDSLAAYEEKGKLYSFVENYETGESVLTLLYDMNWNVGDETFQGKVSTIDNINVNGVVRKRITIGTGDNRCFVVEGIGADWLWYFSGIAPDVVSTSDRYRYVRYMTECYEGDRLIFTQADFESNPISSVGLIHSDFSHKESFVFDTAGMKVANPAKGRIYIIEGGKKVIK